MADPFIEAIYQQTEDFKEHKELLFNAVLQLNAKVVVELGTDLGDSTRILASAVARTRGHLWTIDILPPKWNEVLMQPFEKFMTIITEDSLKVNWISYIDLLLIDSDHFQAHVSSELEKYGGLVRKGGLIFLHDTHHSEFGGGITQAMKEYAHYHKLATSDYPEHHGLGVIYA